MSWTKYNLFFLFGTFLVISEVTSQYCYSKDDKPYRFYSTKTIYQEALKFKSNTSITHQNKNQIPGCEAKKFYLLARHGQSYTHGDNMREWAEILPRLKEIMRQSDGGQLCEDDWNAINSWSLKMDDVIDDHMLSEGGWQEIQQLAVRYKNSFSDLLGNVYDKFKVDIKHSESETTRDSARAFALGLWESIENVYINELEEDNDRLLRFYHNCPIYDEIVDRHIHQHQFESGVEMTNTLNRVRQRLGVSNLTYDDMIHQIYDNCKNEFMIQGQDSPWCAAFTEEDLKVIEYRYDLRYYWEDGYGHPINYQETCKLIGDIQDHITKSNSQFDIRARFAHGSTVDALYARLGLFDDGRPLLATDYSINQNRKWRTSYQACEGANIVFVRYDCTNGDKKVAVYVNEQLQTLPGCTDGICDAEFLNGIWNPIVATCDLDELCAPTVTTTTSEPPLPPTDTGYHLRSEIKITFLIFVLSLLLQM